ncbi:MAG TPA: transcriptional repressor [Phycisphaerae bacterium]|nr:transcriptional repressor [Phycisphaerae bacterium]
MTKPQLTEEEITSAENIFQEFLRERGLKFTRERHTLLHEVLSNPDHFEAEQLLVNLRQSGKRVAKATIYRTLPLLVACGILRQVQFGDKLTHYEHTFGQTPHDHMICRRCRRVTEFDSKEVVQLRTALAARHGFRALSHRLQIFGLCAECVETRLGSDGECAS